MILFIALIMTFFMDPSEPTMLVYPPFGHCMGIYRAGTEQLALLLGGMVRFNDPQGLTCVKLEEWDDPGHGDDDELAVYGVNSGSGHIIYNATMYSLGFYGGNGSDENQLLSPHGITSDPSGKVIVADTGNRRIVFLNRNGPRLEPCDFITTGLVEPWGVALDGSGMLFVTDRAGNRLLRYTSARDTLPEVLFLPLPRGIAATGEEIWSHYDEEFQIAIVDDGFAIVKVENLEITARAEISDIDGMEFFNYPTIDYYGNVWVTDSISCQIHKFDSNLKYLDSFGSYGSGDREFNYPTGIAIWRRFGQVFIAEKEGARYFWIGTDIRDWQYSPTDSGFDLNATIVEPSFILVSITDSSGDIVAYPYNGKFLDSDLTISWDGTNSRGELLPSGEYIVQMELQPTYSSRGYFDKIIEESIRLETYDADTSIVTEREDRRGTR